MMDIARRRNAVGLLLITLIVLVQLACDEGIVTMAAPTPLPAGHDAYTAAQATLDFGQRQAMELSYQATAISLSMDQAASSAAQSTLEYNQRQAMELSYQATAVSQNMAQAAATQEFVVKQTQVAWSAMSTAQSGAATATNSAYVQRSSQTAQAQAILIVQTTQTAQAKATLTAYPLTATPWTALQADILRIRNETERRALWDEFVVTPLTVILLTLVVLLLIVGGVVAFQRLMPVLELRLRTIARDNDSPMFLTDGMFVDPDPLQHPLTQPGSHLLNHSQLQSDMTGQVEIVDPSELSITNWIAEAEQKLGSDARIIL